MIDVRIPKSAINTIYLPYLDEEARVQIYFGGSSSGKSKFLAQRVVYRLLKGGHNYLICRQVARTVRKSAMQEVEKVITEWGLGAFFKVRYQQGDITCKNGYQAVFTGLDDVEKLKSITFKKGVLTDIWVEEATETELTSIKQLMRRQRGKTEPGIKKTITLSFNPILQSNFIYLEYFLKIAWADDQKEYRSDRLSILKTTYKDNRFLEPEDIADLESETDKYYHDVYTLGNWGILGNVIFTNWKSLDLSKMAAQFTNHRNGLDFGFSSDPAALVVTHYDRAHKTIYVYDEHYDRGLTNDMLADEIKKKIGNWVEDKETKVTKCVSTQPVTCDSAEPKSIQELRTAGVDAHGAKKGKDSINFGIQWLQQQTIIIDSKCVNTKREVSTYHWKEDKNGNAIRQPVDKDNHTIDGLRYGYEDDMIDAKVETSENPFYG